MTTLDTAIDEMRKGWRTFSKLWKPIYVDEGAKVPKWYGCSRWIPYDMAYKEPSGPGVYQWQKVFYPIPVNIILAGYYWLRWCLRIGWAIPPQCYRTKIFQIPRICPHCQKDIYDPLFSQEDSQSSL